MSNQMALFILYKDYDKYVSGEKVSAFNLEKRRWAQKVDKAANFLQIMFDMDKNDIEFTEPGMALVQKRVSFGKKLA